MRDLDDRIVVAGRGLAGLTFADELLRGGIPADSILVAGAEDRKAGSSNPGALFHPLPGSSLAPHERKLRWAASSIQWLRRWTSRGGREAIRELSMIRPVTDDDAGRTLRESWRGPDAYPDWFDIRPVDRDELDALDPRLARWDEAFLCRPAFCVRLDELCALLSSKLREAGVDVRTGWRLSALSRSNTAWQCHFGERRLRAESVVLAFGASFGTWFPDLPIDARGGELFVTADPFPDLPVAINGSGHLAPRADGRIVAGSTWWPPESFHVRSDRDARHTLRSRCGELFEPLRDSDGEIWRALRIGIGDHQPIAGPVPGFDQLHVLGGFGGTGLLAIPHHARALSQRFTPGPDSRLPPLSRADRMGAEKWRPDADRLPEPRPR